MSLELAVCDKCDEITMRPNPDLYCMSCRQTIKKRVKHNSMIYGNNGSRILKKHAENLNQVELDVIRGQYL